MDACSWLEKNQRKPETGKVFKAEDVRGENVVCNLSEIPWWQFTMLAKEASDWVPLIAVLQLYDSISIFSIEHCPNRQLLLMFVDHVDNLTAGGQR